MANILFILMYRKKRTIFFLPRIKSLSSDYFLFFESLCTKIKCHKDIAWCWLGDRWTARKCLLLWLRKRISSNGRLCASFFIVAWTGLVATVCGLPCICRFPELLYSSAGLVIIFDAITSLEGACGVYERWHYYIIIILWRYSLEIIVLFDRDMCRVHPSGDTTTRKT